MISGISGKDLTMSAETPKDPQELVEYLQQLQGTLETMSQKLESLEKRLKPLEKEASKQKRLKRQWEKA
jgi:prefoldin subunit 5